MRHAVEVVLLLARELQDEYTQDTLADLLFNYMPFIDFDRCEAGVDGMREAFL